jgi:hypothetical protein
MFGRMILQGVVATMIVAAFASLYAASAQTAPSTGWHAERHEEGRR